MKLFYIVIISFSKRNDTEVLVITEDINILCSLLFDERCFGSVNRKETSSVVGASLHYFDIDLLSLNSWWWTQPLISFSIMHVSHFCEKE